MRSYAFDQENTIQQDLKLVVADLPCLMPQVHILNQVIFKAGAVENWKSMPLALDGKPDYECSRPVPTA